MQRERKERERVSVRVCVFANSRVRVSGAAECVGTVCVCAPRTSHSPRSRVCVGARAGASRASNGDVCVRRNVPSASGWNCATAVVVCVRVCERVCARPCVRARRVVQGVCDG